MQSSDQSQSGDCTGNYNFFKWCWCGDIFSSRQNYQTHVKSCKERQDRANRISKCNTDVFCDYCNMNFPNDDLLWQHMTSVGHGFYRYNFVCQKCGKKFKGEMQFQDHVEKSHSHVCPYCYPQVNGFTMIFK